MEDKLLDFFSETDFDLQEPHSGHLDRFERKLNQRKSINKTSWKWLSVAASILLLIGFYLGSNNQKTTIDLADVSAKMEEAQTFFTATINQELKEVEKYRNTDTERVIEDALSQIEKLEENYNLLISELNSSNKDKRVVYAMISNYQQRIEVLQNLLQQIEQINNPTNTDHETYI